MEVKSPRKRTAEQAFKKNVTSRTALAHSQKLQEAANTRGGKVVTFGENPKQNLDHGHSSSLTTQRTHAPLDTKTRLKQRASDLLKTRQQLPIWSHADEIRNKVKSHDVLLLVGETGSGKSTQLPQFLLPLCQQNLIRNGSKIGGCIAITQPRRVAAISLARRVAEEVGTPLGKSSPASQVGYSVRFDSNTSLSTKIKFVTDGTLLQELIRDPWLKQYSVVVVDEVHERGVNVDLVLGFLKRLIDGRNKHDGRGGVPLKVVVMSATADMDKFQTFFEHAKVGVLSDADDEWNGFPDGDNDEAEKGPSVASCYIKGRQYLVKMHYIPIPVANVLDTAMERIIDIHCHTPLPGDILIFLPGQETIDTLESMCISYAQSLIAKSKEKGAPRLPKLLILPLFAALPAISQQRVFETTPPFTRKVILSTNIAETSVTVPGIRHVIDTGKRKARFFRPGLNLDTLLTRSISRSSANQRAGRAGREAPGNCYRIYTEKTFYELEKDTEPEILRSDLSQVVLILLSHDIQNILKFPLLTPLPIKSLERALLHLLKLKAFDKQTSRITPQGKQMSTLPVPANLARILLASQSPQYNCTEEIIDIVSGLSVENIWLPIHNRPNTHTHGTEPNQQPQPQPDSDDETKNPTAQARLSLYRREGDHLTLLAAIQQYTQEQTDRKDWCKRHAISHRAMQAAMDTRKQLRSLFLDSASNKYKPKSEPGRNHTSTHTSTITHEPATRETDLNTRILKTLLLGLSDRVALLNVNQGAGVGAGVKGGQAQDKSSIWNGPYTALSAGKQLQIHPSSVLFGTRPSAIMFSEFVVTNRAYARCVSAIEAGWLEDD